MAGAEGRLVIHYIIGNSHLQVLAGKPDTLGLGPALAVLAQLDQDLVAICGDLQSLGTIREASKGDA